MTKIEAAYLAWLQVNSIADPEGDRDALEELARCCRGVDGTEKLVEAINRAIASDGTSYDAVSVDQAYRQWWEDQD